ncbi:hypothetical protein [Actinomadura sp. 3N407]|uniref:hypothetical protein n=1 Tax=Actinomadura sp. 3N407 TaxID=3457423 RepID=UPI003FCCE4D4
MLCAVPLTARPDFAVSAVSCRADHPRWSEPDVRDDHRLVLVRRGRFRRRADGASADLDPTLGYLGAPGEEERFAHPAGGDVCTSINLGPRLREGLTGRTTVYVDTRVDMAHRRLLAAAAGGDVDYALTEELLHLIAAAARRPAPGPAPPTVSSSPPPAPPSSTTTRTRPASSRWPRS